MPGRGWSLRARLIAACVLVQLAAGVLVVVVSTSLLQRTLLEQAAAETHQVVALLDQAVAAPLAQRDYATLQQTLDLVRGDAGVKYLVLWDHLGRPTAGSGWDPAKPLPPRDDPGNADLDRADATLHLTAPIAFAGQALGRLDLGLSTERLRAARRHFLQRSVGIGLAALLVSLFATVAIGYAVTRRLSDLAQASERVAAGNLGARAPIDTDDEIGRVGAAFNAMAAALQQRVLALQQSEARQRAHLDAAREEQVRLTTLLSAMDSGIVFVDEHDRVVYANAAFARLWSLPLPFPGLPLAELLPAVRSAVVPAEQDLIDRMSHRAALEGGTPTHLRRELHTLDGRIVVQRMQPVQQGESAGGRIWFHDDVTLERQTQQRAHQALHDPLTRLFNRRGLYEALRGSLAQAASEGTTVALLFIDLDDFKHANDLGGHRAGDDVLAGVARALTAQMRRGEVVARHGGDEFAVVCPGIGPDEAGAIAARLVEAIAQLRFVIDEQTLRVGCSVGFAIYPTDAENEDTLMARADSAMYQAKQAGKNGWAAWRDDPRITQAASARLSWNARIHRALQEQRFALHFQPVHATGNLQVAYHEALVRMVDENDPQRLIAPGEFIAHAERSGKIRLIDRWVFEQSVQLLGDSDASLAIAANLSARSLEDATFPGYLRELLLRHDVDPRRLRIELTETSAIGDAASARKLIDALRALGCAVHLDDFGSGFSSFAQLKSLEVDAIKIDGGFIRDLRNDASNRLFVASMIQVAHHLNKVAVAEHVEDAATLDILRDLNVDFVQGYHLGRPAEKPVETRAPLRLVAQRVGAA